jgi:predicted metalloprotease
MWPPPERPMSPPPAYRYAYAPPRHRSGGAGTGVAVALGFVAFVFVCGIMFMKVSTTGSRALSPGSPGEPIASSSPGSRPLSSQAAPAAGRLYRVGSLNGYGCRGRTIVQGLPSSFAVFLNATTNCLDRTWSTAFRQAGIPFSPPVRVFWTTPGRSPCGDYPAPGAAAFYCPSNHAMYIGVTHTQQAAGGLPARYNVAYAREVAHEYGHHVQDEAGILGYSREARTRAATIEERNAITRRSELQAQCLAGTFMAAVRPSFPVTSGQWQIALRDSYGRGDDPMDPENRDHGSRRHYAAWLNFAFTRGTTSVCDTWTARPSLVS